MNSGWSVKNVITEELSYEHVSKSKHEVEIKVVGSHYEPQGLANNKEYRAMFYEDLRINLNANNWVIVPVILKEIQ